MDSDGDEPNALDLGNESKDDVVMATSPVSSPALVPAREATPPSQTEAAAVPPPQTEVPVGPPEPVPSSEPVNEDKADDDSCFVIEVLEATEEIGCTSLDGVVPQAMFGPNEQPAGTKPLEIMSDRAQWELRAKLSSSRAELTCAARRLHRRL
ncbi:hypothetical protein GGI21_001533, partial [Coemansia aciculifera]